MGARTAIDPHWWVTGSYNGRSVLDILAHPRHSGSVWLPQQPRVEHDVGHYCDGFRTESEAWGRHGHAASPVGAHDVPGVDG